MASENGAKIIHASLYRMGTGSMAAAYKTLGFNPHHFHEPGTPSDWVAFERAVDGKWPDAPGATPQPPFTRKDWDAAHGDYNIHTDFYAHFSADLIRAYPEVKVVIVQRPFESWWDSYYERCVASINTPFVRAVSFCLWLFQGNTMIEACRKQYCGFFGVRNLDEINEEKARPAYDAFFAEIRDLVSPERCLEFDIRDGWEPLCKFLGKDIPDVPFPRVNTRVDHEAMERRAMTSYVRIGAIAIAVSGIAVAIGVAW